MLKAQLEQFLELLSSLVNESGPWQEKKEALLEVASDDDRSVIEEFVGWFGDDVAESDTSAKPDKDTTEDA
jgi:hypothetical protein